MIKSRLKKAIYSSRGRFKYFGAEVYFPSGAHLIERAIEEGVFERDLVRLLKRFVTPNSCFLDIGANLGLMSLPVLREVKDSRVISFEPSPGALPYLQKTQASSPYAARWTVVPKAVASELGTASFFTAGQANSAFDGLANTGRSGGREQVTVDVTTVDHEWKAAGSPQVTAVKIDVEGGELAVLEGARECFQTCRPVVFLEWNYQNLAAHSCPPESLLHWANRNGYQVCQLPHGTVATSDLQLKLQMVGGEEFALIPAAP